MRHGRNSGWPIWSICWKEWSWTRTLSRRGARTGQGEVPQFILPVFFTPRCDHDRSQFALNMKVGKHGILSLLWSSFLSQDWFVAQLHSAEVQKRRGLPVCRLLQSANRLPFDAQEHCLRTYVRHSRERHCLWRCHSMSSDATQQGGEILWSTLLKPDLSHVQKFCFWMAILQEIICQVRRPTDEAEIAVRLKLVKAIPPEGCLQIYNVVLRKYVVQASKPKMVALQACQFSCFQLHQFTWPVFFMLVSCPQKAIFSASVAGILRHAENKRRPRLKDTVSLWGKSCP